MKFKNFIKKIKDKRLDFLSRRPHRSFRRTRRRDYDRSLNLPGYFAFTKSVVSALHKNRKIFLLLGLAYALLSIGLVGLSSQSTYTTLSETLNQTGGDVLGRVGKAGLLFVTSVTSGFSIDLSSAQGVFEGVVLLLTWLTCVWLLRNILAGRKVKLRDGLYNAGSPILPTFLVFLVAFVQMVPAALAVLAYSSASTTKFLAGGGVEVMMFWIVIALLVIMSLYWLTGTLFALVIITLPGMYPFKAIKAAGDLVVGRRVRILLRFLWMAFLSSLSYIVFLLPIILFTSWLNGVWETSKNIPIVPVAVLILNTLTIIWVSSYVYLLYRRIVADDAKPA